jgi:hypothetical protein
MIAVIGCAAWLIAAFGGMISLGLWLERDYQRDEQRLADEAQQQECYVAISYLERECSDLQEALEEALADGEDREREESVQGEIDDMMVEIIKCHRWLTDRGLTMPRVSYPDAYLGVIESQLVENVPPINYNTGGN